MCLIMKEYYINTIAGIVLLFWTLASSKEGRKKQMLNNGILMNAKDNKEKVYQWFYQKVKQQYGPQKEHAEVFCAQFKFEKISNLR